MIYISRMPGDPGHDDTPAVRLPIAVEGELLVVSEFVDKLRADPDLGALAVGDIEARRPDAGGYSNDFWVQVTVGVVSGVTVQATTETMKTLIAWGRRHGLRIRSHDETGDGEPDPPAEPPDAVS